MVEIDSDRLVYFSRQYGLFVETEKDLYLPNLSEYIEFSKDEEKNTIKIKCDKLIKEVLDKVIAVEIYFNPYKINIESNIKGAKMFNIFTQAEV